MERERWFAGKPVASRWRFQLINVSSFGIIAAVGIAMLVTRPIHAFDVLDGAILLLFGWISLSFLWSSDRGRTLRSLGGWLAMGCAVFGVGLTCSLDECVVVVASGCAFYLLVGYPRDIYLARNTSASHYRVQGWLGPNYEADAALLMLFLTIYLFQIAAIGPGLAAMMAFVALATMLLARSRTVTWAALVAVPVWILFGLSSIGLAATCGTLGIAGLGLIGAITPLRDKGWRLLMNGRKHNDVKHLNGRTILWANLWPAVCEHPLLGSGYRAVWTDQRHYQLEALHNFGARISQAHSLYLEALISGGVVALLLVVSVLGKSLSAAFHTPAPAGPFLIGLITYATLHGLGESALLLSRHRSFALLALLVSMPS